MGVAICGMAEREIPEGYERWGMPWDAEWVKLDILFDMHHPSLLTDEHIGRLKEVWQPLYMQEEFYPNVTVYPLEKVMESVGDYFACSISYMLGLAIHRNIRDIVLVGVTGAENYASQRASIEYLIGFARGKGLSVEILGNTELFTGKRYGYV